MKKMIKSLANKAICAAFVVLGAMSVCAELVKTPILQTFDDVAEPVSVGYKVTGLPNDEIAMVYTNHERTATWTVPATLNNVQFLVVGGGGGGGAGTWGPGGGGGGVVTGYVYQLKKDAIVNVKVGVGGKGGTTNGAKGIVGGNSSIIVGETTYVLAYGGGAGCNKANGVSGGSGSGGGADKNNTTTYVGGGVTEALCNEEVIFAEPFGHKGGTNGKRAYASGGGGGAMGDGGDGSGQTGGAGGAGLEMDITGSLITYGSGGGGGGSAKKGSGGINAGNGGYTTNAATPAVANRGGGGGGGGNNKIAGSAGGSGIVVFRYVENLAPEKPVVDNLTYTGSELVGVIGDGFTVVSGIVAATEVGTYTAVLSPDEGVWADGTTGDYEVTWKILPIMTGLEINENDGYIVRGLGDGNEVAVVFTNENADAINWTVPTALNNAQFLVVGGGGGGGADNSVDSNERIAGAGGGGGGVVTGLVNFDRDTVVSVTVGAGGLGGKMSVDASGDSGYGGAYNGEDSIFGVNGIAWVTADGGGSDQGASANNSYLGGKDGSAGGSGAGGRAYANGGAETQGDVNSVNVTSSHKYGFPGGNGCTVANGGYGYGAAGGGGGATAAGYDGTKEDAYKGGDGGAGLTSDITGVAKVYGSGGGGSSTWNSAGIGGEGAGDGVVEGNGKNALANQGGGGGGSSRKAATGGNGGSGIVVFRFEYSDTAVASVNGYGYSNIAEAINAVEAGETVTLLANASNIELGKSIALNLNGCTVDQITLTGTDVTLTAPEDLEVKTSVDGYEVAYDDGVYSLQKVAVVQIGETTYATLAEAVAAAQSGDTIVLIENVELAETVTIPVGKTLTIDLNGKSISMEESIVTTAYALNNLGTLTLKDSVGTGSVNARGIYNGYGNGADNVATAKIIIQSGTYNAKGTNGGAAIFNYGIAEINGGSFTSIGGYSLNNQAGSSMTIADGVTANNGIYCSNAKVTVNGGNISGNRSGCHVVYAWNAELTINGGTFYNNNSGNATIMSAGTTKCTITGGTFGIKDGRVEGNGNTWTSCLTDTANTATMTVTGGIFNGGFRVQAGTTMTIEGGSFNDVGGSGYNIYGTASVKGGTFTDSTAQNFAKANLADGFELNVGGNVVEIPAVAQIGDETFETLEAAFAAAAEGQEIDLLQDATPVLKSQSAITKAAVIDLNGKTLTLTEDDLYFGTTTFKNGTIVVDPSVKPSTAVFWMFANQTLTFDNVKIVATGVTGTYLIGLEGTNCDLNLLNGSEILVENTTALDLDIICVNGSTDNDIVIDNSKINVTNLDGRVLFRGNYTIKGTSEINLAGITKAGIRIEAGQTLSIEDTAKVTIAGEPRDGGIHLTDVTATYTKADTATVTATINKPYQLSGEGTEASPYLIQNIDDLIFFRDSVNKGETKYNAPGVWVALAADIDMAGENWVGIGSITQDHGFMGNFDGKTFKIKNLTINNPTLNGGYAYAGFFSITEGTETAQNIIKNLTIENVTINTTGQIVSAAIAYPYYTIVENVNVCGDINITGGDYTAGALAYTRRCVNASNVSVVGNAGSTITGGQAVGGVISDIQMNGGLIANYSNFAAENLTISGTKMVGGISGIIATQALNGATVKDVTINCADRAGQVAGSFGGTSTISNIVVENVTGADAIIGGGYDGSKPVEAKLGDTFYSTFAEAYAAAKADDTITLLRDVTLTSKLTLNKAVTIDGNGHSIVANHTAFILETSSDCEFKNITLNTNNKAKGVKIASGNVTFDNVTIPNSNKSDAITVQGTLTIKNYFKVESTYQVFDARNGSIYVEEGTVFDFTSRIGLVSPADDDLKAAVDTNGKPYFCAYGSTTYYRTSTSITGTIGTITDLTLLDDVSLNKDITVKGTLDLNGKTLTLAEGKVLKTGGNLTVTGGTFAGPVQLTNASHILTAPEGVEVTTTVAGSRVVYADGMYTVQAINYVAQIGETKYETLASALAAAQNDAVVELLWAEGNAPIAMNGSVFGKLVTITGTATVDWSKGFLFVGRGGEGNGTVIFDNANLESASNNASYGIHVSGREKNTNNKYDGTVVINNSTIVLDYLIDKGAMTMTNSTLTVKNGFAVGGRPASETESGVDATATFDLTNGSTLIVNNYNGMGLGYEAIGVMTIDSTSTFECTQSFLVTDKGVLKSAGNVFGDIVKSDNAQIELTGGIYTDEEVQGWCAEPYAALPNLNNQYVVGVKPTATVNSFGATTVPAGEYGVWNGSSYTGTSTVDMPLSFVMQFLANQNEEDMKTSPFADWYGDFVITFTGIENGSFTADGCYLAGHYGDFGWVKVPVDGMIIENDARYPVMLGVGLGQKYDYICSSVEDFKCAMFLAPEIIEANPNLKVKLELAVVDNSQGSDSAASALVNNDKVFSVTEYEYGAEAFAPALPTATVTSIDAPEGTPLTFALNFKADDVTDAQLAYYRDWYADFVLTITGLPEEGVTFNTDGTADGYLAGQYDAWSENWVSVPFEDITLRNGESIKIMEYAATLMGQSGLKLTYNDVYSFVKNFDCGVYFTPEFLAANPDMKVSLSLRMYKTGDATDEGVAIGEMEEFSAPTVVAKIGSTPYATLEAAIAAAGADDTVTILKNVGTDAAIQVAKKVTIDLNGKTIAATENDKVGDGVFCVVAGGELTINDSVGTGVINGVGDNDYNMAIWAKDGGKVVINGGNFTNVGATDKTDPNAHFDLIYVKNGGEVVINGGTFECETPAFTLNSHDTYKGVITVNGGTFVGFDPRNNAAETAGTTFMAVGKYTFAEGGNYIVVTPEDYILNGAASDSATVGDVDLLLAGAVTVTKDGEKYVAIATYTFKVTAVDTVNPEKSSYELTGGKLRPGKTVAVKYIDLATGAESWVKPESDTVTFKLVIK